MAEPPGERSAIRIAAELAAMSAIGERRDARLRLRQEASTYRREVKRTQAWIRLADAFAKLGGGSLLSATLIAIVNGQLAVAVVVTALLALFLFVASIIVLVRLDRQTADIDHVIDVIEAALKETER